MPRRNANAKSTRPKRRRNTKAKGGQYERQICNTLSLWWSDGHTDDIFWRTAGSGGRATQRSKKGQSTFGNHGDIQATDPAGQPLIDVFAIEIKRGYRNAHIGDLFDNAGKINSSCDFFGFLEQANRSAESAGSPFWLIIHKRDRREAMVYFPQSFLRTLASIGTVPNFRTFLAVKLASLRRYGWFCGTTFSEFLKKVSPNDIKNVQKENGRR